MEKHFMIDIEATGIDHTKEDLLSIGILEAEFSQRYGAVSLAQNINPNYSREETLRRARETDPKFPLPPGKQHDALYDCYSQLHTLNGLIAIARGEA